VRPDPEPEGLAPAYAAGPYADPLRVLVNAHKERRVLALARPLGELLATAVRTALPTPTDVLLVPVPSNPRTVRRRGHDAVLRMVRAAASSLRSEGYRADPGSLLRQYRSVADQAGLGAGDRIANLDGSLALDLRAVRRLAGRRTALVVCDDVITTGSTAREAQRAIEAVGLPVRSICCVAATRRRVPLPNWEGGG
ncbi:MAG TPA: ComF family protein, partial [Marmoricola sp.]